MIEALFYEKAMDGYFTGPRHYYRFLTMGRLIEFKELNSDKLRLIRYDEIDFDRELIGCKA